MKTMLVSAALALAMAGSAMAQNASRTYDLGPVWQISYIETKPGMFDDYMSYLNSTWRSIQEAEKARGDVLDYRVLAIDSPRDGEADVILMIQYKNMAVFDRSLEEGEAVMAKAFGSVPKSNQAAVSREQVRVLRGKPVDDLRHPRKGCARKRTKCRRRDKALFGFKDQNRANAAKKRLPERPAGEQDRRPDPQRVRIARHHRHIAAGRTDGRSECVSARSRHGREHRLPWAEAKT